jgi:hypothetical protein
MQILGSAIMERDAIAEADRVIYSSIARRCHELIKRYPERKMLFVDYLKMQEEENDVLENRIVCATMVIARTTQQECSSDPCDRRNPG